MYTTYCLDMRYPYVFWKSSWKTYYFIKINAQNVSLSASYAIKKWIICFEDPSSYWTFIWLAIIKLKSRLSISKMLLIKFASTRQTSTIYIWIIEKAPWKRISISRSHLYFKETSHYACSPFARNNKNSIRKTQTSHKEKNQKDWIW